MEFQSSAIRHDTNTDQEPGSPPRATVEPVEDSDLISERSNVEEPVARHRTSFLVKESGSEWYFTRPFTTITEWRSYRPALPKGVYRLTSQRCPSGNIQPLCLRCG